MSSKLCYRLWQVNSLCHHPAKCLSLFIVPRLVALGIHGADGQAVQWSVGAGEAPLSLGLNDVILQAKQLVQKQQFSTDWPWSLLHSWNVLTSMVFHWSRFQILVKKKKKLQKFCWTWYTWTIATHNTIPVSLLCWECPAYNIDNLQNALLWCFWLNYYFIKNLINILCYIDHKANWLTERLRGRPDPKKRNRLTDMFIRSCVKIASCGLTLEEFLLYFQNHLCQWLKAIHSYLFHLILSSSLVFTSQRNLYGQSALHGWKRRHTTYVHLNPYNIRTFYTCMIEGIHDWLYYVGSLHTDKSMHFTNTQKVWCGIWLQDVSSWPFKCSKLHGLTSVDWTS